MPRLPLALLLAVALPALGGCGLNDCSFETTEVSGFATVSADATSLGDTLAVVFVDTGEQRLSVFVEAGLRPTETDENVNGVPTVSVSYSAEGLSFGDISPPRPQPFASSLQGGTLYVYAEGTLSPDLFREVCSPPEANLRIDVVGVQAPAGVGAVRVSTIRAGELEARIARTLRQLDAERTRPPLVA